MKVSLKNKLWEVKQWEEMGSYLGVELHAVNEEILNRGKEKLFSFLAKNYGYSIYVGASKTHFTNESESMPFNRSFVFRMNLHEITKSLNKKSNKSPLWEEDTSSLEIFINEVDNKQISGELWEIAGENVASLKISKTIPRYTDETRTTKKIKTLDEVFFDESGLEELIDSLNTTLRMLKQFNGTDTDNHSRRLDGNFDQY